MDNINTTIIEQIRPHESGIKHVKKAPKDFTPDNLTSFSLTNEALFAVKAALFLEFLSKIKKRPTIKRSNEANCMAVWRSSIPYHVLKIPVVNVWIAK